MKRLSRKAALEKCKEHWQNLTETGTNNKWSVEPCKTDHPKAGCYACEYTDKRDQGCDHCPLLGYAWARHCQEEPSLYYDWLFQGRSVQERQKYARRMVKAIDAALQDLTSKGQPRKNPKHKKY